MANTYKLKYTASQIDEILERADKEPLVLYYDKTASLYRGFASRENRDLWIDSPEVNAELELFNFVAPAPFTLEITPLNEKTQYILSGDTGNFIEFSFRTVDDKEHERSESVDVTFKFDDLKGNVQSITQTYNSGETVKFNVDKYLRSGTNIVTVIVEGRLTGSRNNEDWKFTVVSLDLTSTFNVALPVQYGKTFSVPFKVKGPDGTSPIVEFIVDADEENLLRYQASVSEEDTRQEINNRLLPGKHTLQVRAKVNLSGTEFYSGTKYLEFIVKDSSLTGDFISISQDFPNTAPLVDSERTNLRINAEQFVQTSIPWGFYSGTVDYADITWKLDGEIISLVSTHNSDEMTNYAPSPLKFIPTKIGDFLLEAYKGDVKIEEYNIKVIGNTHGVVEASSFLELKLSGFGRNNGETNVDTWSYTSNNDTYTTDFIGDWAWSINQGWSNDALQVSGGAQAIINYAPLSRAPQTNGATFEIEFEVLNVNNPNAALVSIVDERGAGIKITGERATITSSQGNSLNTQFIPGERLKLAFIIFPNSGDSPRMMYIMNNGVYERGLQYSDTDSFNIYSNIILGDPNGEASIRVYSIRCYTRALTKDEEFKHYIIDSGDIAKKIIENDILVDGSTAVSVSKMSGIIPTFLFTGDIDALLAANDKETQRSIDVEFINPFDRSKNFKITHARMKLQGTSSLGYPRKNFKLYSGSKWDAVMYDFEGNILTDGNYAFADGDVPVHTWTLKADFSDSSCTHNASVARLFGDIEPLVMVNNERVLMTPPQKAATQYKDVVGVDFPYQIRTTPNALAAVAFYRQDDSQDYIFMGQYTLLNDKGNDEVYGFKSIYKNGLDPYYFESEKDKSKVLWDNKNTHCFEVLDNTNIYSTFSSTDGFFDTYVDDKGITHQNWEKAFESRYPEIEDEDTLATRRETAQSLYDFIEWIKTTIGNQAKFEAECEKHLDLYKCASYYIYLIRFGAVDQVQKNMMWTTYGTKSSSGDFIWFPIRYDNDTILGLANTGNIAYDYNITRQTVDPASSNGSSYCYAGHDSWLWNALEGSTKFMNTVRTVDGALYEVGLNYKNVCHYFDDLASDQWCERIYNDNQEYKYIQPLLKGGRDWMVFMQGKRKTHRHWWLKNRFDICDALYVTGEYVNRSIRLIAEGTPAGSKMYFKAAKSTNFGWGINKVPQQNNVPVEKGESFVFSTESLGRALAKGDPVYIYCSNNIEEADFHELAQYLSSVINIDGTYDSELGTNLKVLKIGVPEDLMEQGIYNRAKDITFSGFNNASRLEYLDVRGLSEVIELPFMKNLVSLKTLLAKGTGLAEFTCAEGIHFDKLELPNTVQTLELIKCGWDNISFIPEQLDKITFQGMGTKPEVQALFWKWVDLIINDESTRWSGKSVYIDGIEWGRVDVDKLITLKENLGDKLSLRGRIGVLNYRENPLGSGLEPDQVTRLQTIFRDPERPDINIFDKESSPNLYITAPDSVFIYPDDGKTEILEGETLRFNTTVFSSTGKTDGTTGLHITSAKVTHGERFSDDDPALLVTEETGAADAQVKITAVYVPKAEEGVTIETTVNDIEITVKKRVYARELNVSGKTLVMSSGDQVYTCTTIPEESELTGIYKTKNWSIEGAISSVAEIINQTGESCKVHFNLDSVIDEIVGNLVITYTKEIDDTQTIGKLPIIVRNDRIAISKSTNPNLFEIFKNSGLCKNANYMTTEECAAVVEPMLVGTDGYAESNIFYKNRSLAERVTSFDEFRHFVTLRSISPYLFKYFTSLESIVIPNNIVSIEEGAFYNCGKLKSVTFSNVNLSSLNTIGLGAFYGTAITSLEIPRFCNSIEETAFYGSKVKDLGTTCPGVIDRVGWKEESGNGWKLKFVLSEYDSDFEIPDDITSIDNYCFSKCNKLRRLIIKDSRILPQSSYFGGCSAVIEGTNSINGIGWKYGTTLLGILPSAEIINIPQGITNIGSYSITRGKHITLYQYQTTDGGYHKETCIKSETYYNTTTEKSISITIPSSVETIENYAFAGNTKISSVSLSAGLKSIGNNAFSECQGITTINLPDTVDSLGTNCFSNCTSLTNLRFATSRDKALTLGNYCFYNCSSLTSVNVPDYIVSLPDSCFYNCESLREINLGTKITRLGSSCFRSCKSLSSIVLPDSVSTLGSNCFSGCTSLSRIEFPENSIKTIDSSCFLECTSLLSINIPDSVQTISSSVFKNCTNLEEIVLPKNLKSISDSTFNGCKSLARIELPENITNIGTSSFEGCESLIEIILPASVTSLGSSCFRGCTSLEDINLDRLTSIGSYCFSGDITLISVELSNLSSISNETFKDCTYLVNVVLGDNIASIGEGAFSGCSRLGEIILPIKLTSLGKNSFNGCSNLQYIRIGELVSSIGDGCFAGCSGVKTIITTTYVPATLGTNVWGTTDKAIGSLVSGNKVFLVCSGSKTKYSSDTKWKVLLNYGYTLKEGYIEKDGIILTPNKNTILVGEEPITFTAMKINGESVSQNYTLSTSNGTACESTEDYYWFGGTESEPDVKLTKDGVLSVTERELEAEYNLIIECICESTTISKYITISTNLLSLQDSKKVITKEGNPEVMRICKQAGWASGSDSMYEYECREVADLGNVFSGNTKITLFNELQYFTGLLGISRGAFQGSTSLTGIKLPSSIERIDSNAFYGCTSLLSVEIPSGLISMQDHCFYGCSLLETITLPEGLQDIGSYCFYGCKGISRIDLPSTLKSMGDNCFNSCESLKSINFPTNSVLTRLPKSCFNGCKLLSSITLPDSIEVIDQNCFEKVGANLRDIKFPANLKRIESSACTSLSIRGALNLPESCEYIGDSCFSYCTELTSVSLPGIKTLGQTCFKNCTSLTTVLLSDELTRLEASTFQDCANLRDINIPKNLNYLGSGVFFNENSGSKIKSLTLPDGLVTIGSQCFRNCYLLETINIPDSVTTIESGAFQNCLSLQEIELPEGITTLDNYTFFGCNSLKKLTLPSNLTFFGNWCFAECNNISDLYIKGKDTKKLDTIDPTAFEIIATNVNVNSDDIIAKITSLEDNEFFTFTNTSTYRWNLEGTGLSPNVSQTNITSRLRIDINMPEDGYLVFNSSTGLLYGDSFTCLLDNTTKIQENRYNAIGTKTKNSSGQDQFNMNRTDRLEIDRVMELSKGSHTLEFTYTSGYTSGLRSVKIADIKLVRGVSYTTKSRSFATGEDNKVLYTISGLNYNDPDYIYGYLLETCGFIQNDSNSWYIKEGDKVLTVYPSNKLAFSNLSSGDVVDIDASSVSGKVVFEYKLYNNNILCSKKNGLYYIGDSNSPDVTLDSTYGILRVTENEIQDGYDIVVRAEDILGTSYVEKEFSIAPYNDVPYITATSNPALFEVCKRFGKKSEDAVYISDCRNVTDEEFKEVFNVANTNVESFEEFKEFTKITTIPQGAFSGYTNLENITLPKNLKEIGQGAFRDCTKLNLTDGIPEGVITLGQSAFQNSGIETIELPESLKTIGAQCFSGCTELSEIISNSRQAPSAQNNSFTGVGSNVSGEKTLYVPQNSNGYNGNGWNSLTDFILNETL